jgi:hypothetical protein
MSGALLPVLLLIVPLIVGIIDFASIGRAQPVSPRF